MKVLVTGATGAIGRPLTDALAKAGHQVRAAVRDPQAQIVPAAVERARIGDLAGPIDWAPLLAGMDAVVHLAGIAHTDAAGADYERVNHQATAALARAAAAAGIKRVIFASSIRAQSGPHADHALTEADAPQPSDAYGRSKLAAEAAVRAAGVPFTILRPVLVLTPDARGNLEKLIWLARLPLPLPFGLLRAKRSLLSIDNLTSAVAFALTDSRAANETFILSDPDSISFAGIITVLRGALGRRPGLVSLPPALMAAPLRLIGEHDLWLRMAGALEAPPTRLLAAGWQPVTDTAGGLAALMRPSGARVSH